MTRAIVTLFGCALTTGLLGCRSSGPGVEVTSTGHGAPGAADDAGQVATGGGDSIGGAVATGTMDATTATPDPGGAPSTITPILDDAGLPTLATLCPSFHGTSNTLTLMGDTDDGLVFLRSDGRESELGFTPLTYGWSWVWNEGWIGVYRYATGGEWQAAVLSPLGDLSYRADGQFSDLRFSVYVESITIDTAQVMTVDHEIVNDDGWLSTGPLGDLVLTPDGQGGGRGQQVYLGEQDVDGWVAAPFGLYHLETGDRRELGDGLNDAVHTLRDGHWIAAQIENREGRAVATILDAEATTEHDLGPELGDLFTAKWVNDDALVALAFGEVPLLCFEQSADRVTPLVTDDASNPDFPYSDGNGILFGRTSGSTWLVDVDEKLAIPLSELGVPDEARVVASETLWWILVDGRPVLTVSRENGEETVVELVGIGDATETFASGGSLLVLSDADLVATLDADTGLVRSVPDEGRAQVDELVAYGAWILGLSAGRPLWVVSASSLSTRTLSDVPPSADGLLNAGNRLLLLAGTTPVAVLDEEGEVRVLDEGVVASLEAATYLELQGDWVFGLREHPSDELRGDSVVWRLHLRTRELDPVPEPDGYVQVFDEGYLLDAGDGRWLPASDASFDDGSIVTLRRTESAAQFLLYARGGWTPLGDPMPEVVHGTVVHDANYFILTAEPISCFCTPPTTSWEPSNDLLISAQLVLLGDDGASDTLTTVGDFPQAPAIHPESACIVWDTGEALLAVDAPTRSVVSLPPANYRWLLPKR